MKIYFAGGFTVSNVVGRERELYNKFSHWHRLHSYHFLDLIKKSEIIEIIKDENLPSK